MLALTGGVRGTDSIELFQSPAVTGNGIYTLEFYVRSLCHLPRAKVDNIETLNKGDKLFLMKDDQNSFEALALAVRTDTPAWFVGYCPKYYAEDLSVLLANKNSGLEVHVKCVNVDAPLNMRLLCSVTATVPSVFSPLGNANDFQPIISEDPDEWQQLTVSLEGAPRA